MAFRFDLVKTVAENARGIAQEQVDDALAGLVDDGGDVDKGVHNARKALKKLRALLRLVRNGLGDDVYRQENGVYRDLGRMMSARRESMVRLRTWDNLIARHGLCEEVDAGIRARLAETVADLDGLPATINGLRMARERIADWRIDGEGFDVLAPGLRRTYERGRLAMRDAYQSPNAEAFHEWRKRVKYHWYHLRLLTPLWAEVLAPWADQVHALSTLLGEDHDLAELALALRDRERFAEPEVGKTLALIAERRQGVEAQARILGQKVYAEKPKRMMQRLEGLWRAVVDR